MVYTETVYFSIFRFLVKNGGQKRKLCDFHKICYLDWLKINFSKTTVIKSDFKSYQKAIVPMIYFFSNRFYLHIFNSVGVLLANWNVVKWLHVCRHLDYTLAAESLLACNLRVLQMGSLKTSFYQMGLSCFWLHDQALEMPLSFILFIWICSRCTASLSTKWRNHH